MSATTRRRLTPNAAVKISALFFFFFLSSFARKIEHSRGESIFHVILTRLIILTFHRRAGLTAAEAVAAMLADDFATKGLSEKAADALVYRMYKNLPVN